MFRFSFLVVLALVVMLMLSARAQAASYAGTYKDERITVTIEPAVNTGQGYTGMIRMGEQSFPLRGSEAGGVLKGTFTNEGNSFEFTATLEDGSLNLRTGQSSYSLRRQEVNPLARPGAANPLARAQADRPARADSPAGPPQGALRLVRYSMKDEGMIGGEAFTMLIPVDWRVQGGVGWRLHPVLPAYVAMKVTSPDGQQELEGLGQLPFVWADGGIAFFPIGSNYMGNEVLKPIEDPVEFIRQVVIPRFRRDVNPRIVAQEALPKIAQEVLANNQEAGIQKTAQAVRVRLEYQQGGRNIEEDLFCVLLYARAPMMNMTFWNTERLYSFKATKGQLDENTRLFQTIIASIRPNLQWFNRYEQLVQILIQNQLANIRRTGELSRYIARTNDEISDMRRQSWENQQRSQDRINQNFSNYIRGVEQYKDPHTDRTVDLPSGYGQVWGNALGEYILSDSPGYNPNVGSTQNWQELPKQGP